MQSSFSLEYDAALGTGGMAGSGAAVFLASKAAACAFDQVLTVDGGWIVR